ncbi:MAG TPA: hypothetical protein VMY35_16105 [Phycisphaerae bacterium]|nr:hypothetical protein [bacterium]HUX02486.1 hypothetical protein [Phycisphaerae bacterium]
MSIQNDADVLLQFVAGVGLATRHGTAEAAGRGAAFLYAHVMRNLPELVQRAVEELEKGMEPEFLQALEAVARVGGARAREGKSAALEVAELLYGGGAEIPPPP